MTQPDTSAPAAARQARLAVVTVSDTHTPDTDESGKYLRRMIREAGHEVAESAIVQDDAVAIRTLLVRLLREVDLIIMTGGTELGGRDVAIPVVDSLLVKPIPGFGELFRVLSYGQMGGAAMLARATGGLTRGALLFALPGSLKAVQIAWDGILKTEVNHLVTEVLPHPHGHSPATAAAAPRSATVLTVPLDAPLSVPSHAEQHSAGLGRHAGVSAAPSTTGRIAEERHSTDAALGRHAPGRNER